MVQVINPEIKYKNYKRSLMSKNNRHKIQSALNATPKNKEKCQNE